VQWINIAKHTTLVPPTLNSIVAKKMNSQQIDKCGKSCKMREIERKSTFCKPESILLAYYHNDQASGIPTDGNILHARAKKADDKTQADEFGAYDGWICRVKNLIAHYTKLTGEGTVINSDTRDPQLDRLPILLDG